jgi:hypothetical protein
MKQRMTVAALIAQALEAHKNCVVSNNTEWADRHEECIHTLVETHLPRGNGFGDTKFVPERSTPTRLRFAIAYHHMNEDGYYDGWSDHVVDVRPQFAGLDIRVSGRNRNDIKEYIHEAFFDALLETP